MIRSMITISCAFDSGSIEALDTADPARLRVALRADSHADIRQWFHFRVSGVRGLACALRFENAGQATYPAGWQGYRVCATHDRTDWFRLPTEFDGSVMTTRFESPHDTIWLAYFEPYPAERHLQLLGEAQASGRARVERLGASLEGRDLDMIVVGGPSTIVAGGAAPPRAVWVVARQHPGETMAQWFVEGLLRRLLDRSDPVARAALERAVFHLVPNINPDGAARGNLRTNAAGANLNREWAAPDAQRSPEVLLVRERMIATGVHAFVDAHGDEALPYVFIDGPERVPGFDAAQAARLDAFRRNFRLASPDFQTVHGYRSDKATKANLSLASKWVAHRFGALSVTLEMPFKDNADAPDARAGWNGARSARLGEAALVALLADLGD